MGSSSTKSSLTLWPALLTLTLDVAPVPCILWNISNLPADLDLEEAILLYKT